MALTIVFPLAPGPIGPGYYVQVQQSTPGPIPVDDIFIVTVQDTGTNLLSGMRMEDIFGTHFPQSVMGLRFDADTTNGTLGRTSPAAPGSACQVNMVQTHVNGVVVDAATDTGAWTWDPTGGIGELVAACAAGAGGSGVAQVLAAVTKTVVNSP